jgi:hypothetical protein
MSSAFSLAGRRTDAPGTAPRFPLANVAAVRERLRELFDKGECSALFCAAACGADLVALDLAADLTIPAWIVLPFAPERFRETSVVDRPGDWGPIYDRHIASAARAGRLITHDHLPGDDETYRKANEDILDAAVRFASDRELRAAIAWEGKRREGSDITYLFAESARARGMPVHEILTL